MSSWSVEFEEEITLLLKDWLKQQGRTQADLRRSLHAESTRMPALLKALKQEHHRGGLPKLAELLCSIEKDWAEAKTNAPEESKAGDPFGQLDLLLQEIRDDCDNQNF